MKPPLTFLARLAPAIALVSCAAPKAVVVENAPKPKKEVAEQAAPPEPVMPGDPYDGLRVPESSLLALPSDGDFRSTVPAAPRPGTDGGTVIARPPTEPPPRKKLKDAE